MSMTTSGLPTTEVIVSKSGATLGPDRATKITPLATIKIETKRSLNFTFFFQSQVRNLK